MEKLKENGIRVVRKGEFEQAMMEMAQKGDYAGVWLVDKPAGVSSFRMVAILRRRLSEMAGKKVKVGHTGTLDPFATGLLVLLSGKATRLAGEFLGLDKAYEAEMRLGAESETGDSEGEVRYLPGWEEVRNEESWQGIERSEFERVRPQFIGEVMQVVPRYSAVKIGGERAYRRARRGEEMEMPKRKIVVTRLELMEWRLPIVKFRAEVSSGTYVRTLGEDIAKAMGVRGYLTGLRRERVGEFEVREAEEMG